MILLDTAPLVALCDPRDSLNPIALRDLDRLSRQPWVVCGAVLTEACVLLPRPVQRRRLRAVLEEFSATPYSAGDELGLRTEVFEWLERYKEHEPDWADGYLAVVSGRERRSRVWTYDREFQTIWRRPDGTPIPLAVA